MIIKFLLVLALFQNQLKSLVANEIIDLTNRQDEYDFFLYDNYDSLNSFPIIRSDYQNNILTFESISPPIKLSNDQTEVYLGDLSSNSSLLLFECVIIKF